MLTKRQKEILDFITNYIENNDYAPSLEEIKGNFGLSSLATVHQHVENLKEKGYLKKKANQPRAIELNNRNNNVNLIPIPLSGTIAAGEPIEAIEDPELINIPVEIVPNNRNNDYYILKVEGDSMIEEGIKDGDLVLVKEQNTAEKGETVVVLLDNENATLKKYYPQKNRVKLEPANEKLKPIYVKNCQIQGKVISVIRKFEK